MDSGIDLIVGLGNPGPEYAETRHNAGFRFLGALLAGSGQSLGLEHRFSSELGKLPIAGRHVWLLAPQTFMNRSGEAVGRFAHFYKLPPERILVVHDELDLPPGVVRLKQGGGDGGHNGLHDIIEKLGSAAFLRLRLGIGHPGSAPQVASYVLKRAPLAEQQLIDQAIAAAKAQLPDILDGQYQRAMNALHARKINAMP